MSLNPSEIINAVQRHTFSITTENELLQAAAFKKKIEILVPCFSMTLYTNVILIFQM